MADPTPDLEQLAPAPRPLPRALAARVWLNGVVVTGLVGLCLSGIGFTYAARHAELPGEWHLLWERREAPGWLAGVHTEQHHDSKRGHTVTHTYSYTFVLPDGRRVDGHCSNTGQQLYHVPRRANPNRPADLTIEYHPVHVGANRIKGLRSSSGGAFVLLGLILPAMALGLTGYGLWSARAESRLLRLGEPSAGHVNQCRLPPRKHAGSAQAGGASVSWVSTSSEPFQPVEEFRDRIWGEHRAAVEAARGMHNNPTAYGCGMALGLMFSFCFGGGIGALALLLPTFVTLYVLNLLDGRATVPLLTAGGVGWLIGGLLYFRRMKRAQYARVSDEALEARPAAFDRVECGLSFWLSDGQSVGETTRTLKLSGGPEDEEPRPLLYDPDKPARTLFVDEMSVPPDFDEGGQWRCSPGFPFARLALVLLLAAVSVAAVFQVF